MRTKLISILKFLPILSLILSGIAWLRFGIDVPFWDDWRSYDHGNMGSFALSHLFKPENDTLYPVGKMLDSLAYRFLDGNAVAYQFISMTSVLGLLLLLQWCLLSIVLKDRLAVASVFCLTLLMIQPDTYWGWQNVAYHQAIPLVCIFAALYVVCRDDWNNLFGIPALLVLGLLSGFAYISGAFTVLVLGAVLLILSQFIEPVVRKPFRIGGATLLSVGLFTSIAQAWVIVVVQKGSHLPGTPMAWPVDRDFWFYMLGKFARSLMFPIGHPALSLFLTGVALLLTLGCVFFALSSIFKHKAYSIGNVKLAIVLVSIFSVILTYLFLVSSGRANDHPAEINTSIKIFTYGFYRFHFFWVTLLWPWVAAVFIVILKKFFTPWGRVKEHVVLIVPLMLVPYFVYAGVLNHMEYFKQTVERRVDGVVCLRDELQNGKGINCPGIMPAPLTTAFFNGRDTGASFARTIKFRPIPMGSEITPVVFRMTESLQSMQVVNTMHIGSGPDGNKFSAGIDPMFFLKIADARAMEVCKTLDVVVLIRAAQPDIAQIFYTTSGQSGFTEAESRSVYFESGSDFKELYFSVDNKNGFVSELRFDPVAKAQPFELKGLEVRCRR